MASKLNQILSIFFFLFVTLNSPSQTAAQECPYPCYPPPTGGNTGGATGSSGGGNTGGVGGNNPPATTLSPPSQTGYYYPPPSTVFPYNPPNPNFYGGAPPSPDPIVPWFPYYFKKPPHDPDQSSSTGVHRRSTVGIVLIHILVFPFLLLVL